MKCPHCNEDLRYKERGGRKCSKCRREFAFEPKTDRLGLHDARFCKAVAKLSADGKFSFTAGQLFHFLSRKRIRNSFSAVRGVLIFLTIAATVVSFALVSTPIFYFAAPAAVSFLILTIVFWKKEGDLNLPVTDMEFQKNVLQRWNAVYGSLPPQLLPANLNAQKAEIAEKTRGALVCTNDEIIRFLAANRISEDLNLIFINLSSPQLAASEKSKIEFLKQRNDLPIFVLHDASAAGCAVKDEFVRAFLGEQNARRVFDIGLRPADAIKANLMRLKKKSAPNAPPNSRGLSAEEIDWLDKGNYTPLLALAPAQLINLVARAVRRRAQIENQTIEKRRAETVGFMTWLGE